MTQHLRALIAAVNDTAHVVAMVGFLRPAADYLPADWARALAAGLGAMFACTPRGLTHARRFAGAMGLSPAAGFRGWCRVQARPFTDFVALRRTLIGAEAPGGWTVTDVGLENPSFVRNKDASFIVAVGHFSREAMLGLYLASVLPQQLVTVVAALPPRRLDPWVLRTRVNFGQILEVIRRLRPNDFTLLDAGRDGSGVRQLVRRLRQPGTAAIVSVDAMWRRRHGYVLPFAGERARSVATGAATIARLSQRPIIPCVPILVAPGQVVLEWGRVIPPPDRDDAGADQRITDTLLRFFETANGKRPDQYVAPIAYERRWDAVKSRWVDDAGGRFTVSRPGGGASVEPSTGLPGEVTTVDQTRGPMGRARAMGRAVSKAIEDVVATAAMVAVLRPVADLAPPRLARAVASLSALALAASPRGLVFTSAIRRAFALSLREAFLVWWSVQARPFIDFVVLRNILRGRDHPDTWHIREENAAPVQRLRAAGESFIVATGHFAREGYVCLYTRQIIPQHLTTILAPVPGLSLRPSTLRTRVNFGQIVAALRHVRPSDSEIVVTDRRTKLRDLLVERLRTPGHVLINAVDAYWTIGHEHLRPFAGERARPIAVGTARIARLSQRPIVPCVPIVAGPGRIVVRWGDPIPPPRIDNERADYEVTGVLLEFLETAVGMRPDQYVAPLAFERRWDRERLRWDTRPGASRS